MIEPSGQTGERLPPFAGGELPPRESSLEQLMEAYQQGNHDAAAEMITSASPSLLRYFLRFSRDRNEAEDLLQEAWLRIHRARHTYRPGLRALPWLFAIAEHTRLDAYRKLARRRLNEVVVDQLPDIAPPTQPPSSALVDIDGLLDQLPLGQKEVILLLKYSGLSLEEVARIKGSTTGAIKLKAHRAYETLRGLLFRKENRSGL